ncbi:MAG TPA: class I SAM-dependent methyltransferase [Crenotrichaceae bacterium]|nr:class I SAM-dependent methyltransferase [Crenotrichaceae bacterium]
MLFKNKSTSNPLGIGLKAGDEHYRAYVGPPHDYDLISAMVFNLLTSLGLRQHHRVLDIGCGSLRIGRLLIPYLNQGNYFGVEPNRWLVNDGIKNETGRNLINIKKPTFCFDVEMQEFNQSLNIDYAIAQSIFSHCGKDLITHWLKLSANHLADNGALLATFVLDEQDFEGDGWVYPHCVKYKTETIASLADECDLGFQVLDWKHPRQVWALFSKKDYDQSLCSNGNITWNHLVTQLLNQTSEPGKTVKSQS